MLSPSKSLFRLVGVAVLSVFFSIDSIAQADVNRIVKADTSETAQSLYITIDYQALHLFNDSVISTLNADGDGQ